MAIVIHRPLFARGRIRRPEMHVLLERPAPARRLTARISIAAIILTTLGGGCGSPQATRDVTASWTVEPPAPGTTSSTRALLTLRSAGQPVRGARLRLEGHMPHPGMAPLVADLIEREGGVYEARLSFTMAGAWTLVADGTLPDGRRLTRSFDVPDVR